MSVSGLASRSTANVQNLLSLRAQLDDLQTQLGTGKKSTTYAGLGIDRGFSVNLRANVAKLATYDGTIDRLGTRLAITQTTLTNLDTVAHAVKTSTAKSPFVIDGNGQTQDQRAAASQLDVAVSLLNTQVGDSYVFSGSSPDVQPVESADHILNGDGAKAGLKQLISERGQADLGASGLGRLDIPASSGTTLSVTEDSATSPFGFKLASASSTLTGATVTGPAGSPNGVSVDLGATNPNAGETLNLSFNLPDGTTASVSLQATTSSPPGANQFTIGVDSTVTAANLQAALTTSVGALAGSTLKAASAVQASNEFFAADKDHPPLRVSGSPANAATSLVAGTSSDSVIWYNGEDGSSSARSTSAVRVDDGIVVNAGARANEDALRNTIKSIAVYAATSYSASDPNAEASYNELSVRVATTLDVPQGTQKISDIEADLAGAQTSLQSAKDRHTQTSSTLQGLLQNIEGVNDDEVAASILALQTSLQSSLQTTAMLYKTSLVNYL